jgi:uncharacterized protein YeaO (DUF488 family)
MNDFQLSVETPAEGNEVMVIRLKPKTAKKLNAKAITDELFKELSASGFDIRRDFARTTKTWQGDKPEFRKETKRQRGGLRLTIFMVGEGIDIWNYLDRGTSVRYATMSPDFQAKTAPRVVDSRRGSGRRLFVDKSRPRPGIKAREWRIVLTETWEPELNDRLEAAFERGVKKTGHYIKR